MTFRFGLTVRVYKYELGSFLNDCFYFAQTKSDLNLVDEFVFELVFNNGSCKKKTKSYTKKLI